MYSQEWDAEESNEPFQGQEYQYCRSSSPIQYTGPINPSGTDEPFHREVRNVNYRGSSGTYSLTYTIMQARAAPRKHAKSRGTTKDHSSKLKPPETKHGKSTKSIRGTVYPPPAEYGAAETEPWRDEASDYLEYEAYGTPSYAGQDYSDVSTPSAEELWDGASHEDVRISLDIPRVRRRDQDEYGEPEVDGEMFSALHSRFSNMELERRSSGQKLPKHKVHVVILKWEEMQLPRLSHWSEQIEDAFTNFGYVTEIRSIPSKEPSRFVQRAVSSKQLKSGDLLIVYYFGHGFKDSDNSLVLTR